MKSARTAQALLVAVLLLLCAATVWAKGTPGIKNTIHNLSTTAPYPYYASDETEICVFCHTPHGGVLSGPLWNRSNTANNIFTHYNSATLSTELKNLSATRPVNNESLLCMACHDGSISVMHLLNPTNNLGRNPQSTFVSGSSDIYVVPGFSQNPGAKIGGLQGNAALYGQLQDDHPISFSYSDVLASPEYGPGGAKENDLRDIGDKNNTASALGWQGEGVRFFGDDDRVECSSCHDPHVDYVTDTRYSPFLIRPNDGSNLCLACHDK